MDTRPWPPGWRVLAGRAISRNRDITWWFYGRSLQEGWRGGGARILARSSCWTSSFPATSQEGERGDGSHACRMTFSRSSPATIGGGMSAEEDAAAAWESAVIVAEEAPEPEESASDSE